MRFAADVVGLSWPARFEPKDALQVVGAGYARTGTQSLKHALTHLGFSVYHMDVVNRNLHTKSVIGHFRGNDSATQAWMDAIVRDGYDATLDFPTCFIATDLAKRFPESKVILTLRDSPAVWMQSYLFLLHAFAPGVGFPYSAVFPFPDMVDAYSNQINCTFRQGVWSPWYMPWVHMTYKAEMDDSTACMRAYESHLAKVRSAVPADQLLEFQPSQGWAPLCEFLGVPVPDTPFPHVNTKADLEYVRLFLAIVAVAWPTAIIGPLVLLFCIVRGCRAAGRASTRPKQD
mmetsp:Transcript_3467/g.10636  ORF Transcript_3467/g.10636 Transcript_3467/m.10636 type:complete len:288 (+) Transcript_3467:725-1588(+)